MFTVGNIFFGCYHYTHDLLTLEAAVPDNVVLPAECLRISSPLNPDVWDLLLAEHPDRQFVEYIIRGIRCGFRIGCHASVQKLQLVSSNMPLANSHPEVIDNYLRDKLECNRLVEVPPSEASVIHISRFRVIPKKRQPGRWRLIVDLSSPLNQSVNDFIDPSLCSLSYTSVKDAAAMAMEIRLPEEKLQRLKSLLRTWLPRKSCTKRELLSLCGSLQHASAVVKPGSMFLQRMIDLSRRHIHLDAPMRLNAEFRADLRWWATFINS